MKKYSFFAIPALLLITFSTISFAQNSKVITLKDGSVLKGEVVELSNGVYTLKTSHLGEITIPEDDILSIASPQAIAPRLRSDEDGLSQSAQLKSQVQAMQSDILSDPELTAEIQDLISDPEIQAILSDPALINDIMTYNPEKIQQNENIQSLLENRKIQILLNKISQKLPPQE